MTVNLVWHVGLTEDGAGRMAEPDRLWAILRTYAARVVAADTSVTLRFLQRTAMRGVHPLLVLVNSTLLLGDVLQCEDEGYDGIMLGPAVDPALDEARGVTGMVVVGSLESALAMSTFVGRQVGLLTVGPGFAAIMEQNVRRYGLQQRLIPGRGVRHFALDYRDVDRALEGDGRALIAAFEQGAQALIDDGAEVVIGAFQWLGAMLDHLGYSTMLKGGVPFLDCAAAGLKMAESLVSLRASVGLEVSNAPGSIFRRLDREQALAALKLRGA